MIEAKRKGKEVHAAAEVEDGGAAGPDRRRCGRASSASAAAGGRRNAEKSPNGNLDGLSKSELDSAPKRAGIEGRSKMSKDELVEALRGAA